MTHRFALFFSTLLLALAGLTSCQTAVSFGTPGANWASYQGQLHYSNPAGRSVVGEVVARRSPDGKEFQLQFSSGPGFPLVKILQFGDSARAEGLIARGNWTGQAPSARATLRNWLRLREVFAQLSPGRSDLRGPGWTATATYAAAEPARCDVSFVEGGEQFAFQFSR